MIDRGVYLPCSQFEAAFISAAHNEGRIDETRTKVFDPGGTVVEPVPHDEAKLLPPIPDPEQAPAG